MNRLRYQRTLHFMALAAFFILVSGGIAFAQDPPWNCTSGTGKFANIAVPSAIDPTLDGQPLSTGDVVGIFYDDGGTFRCGGSSTWQEGQNMQITAWGDDDQTSAKDGFAEGDVMHYKVWQEGNDQVHEALVSYQQGEPTYTTNGIYVLASLEASSAWMGLGVAKVQNGSVDFGNGTAVDIAFSGVSSSVAKSASVGTPLVVVQRFNEMPTDRTGLEDRERVSVYRWEIEIQGGSVSFSDAEVSFRQDEITDGEGNPIHGIGDINTVDVYRRHPPGNGDWGDPIGSNGNGSLTRTSNELTASGFGEFGEYVFASDACNNPPDNCVNPLPVELVSFDAIASSNDVVLRWQTVSETNNAGFEVQHQDGGTFTEVGFVEGAGTTTQRQEYTYRVEGLAPGRHVFRLKQVDFDGAFEYGPEVEVSVEVPGAYHLSPAYPNPFNPQTRFTLAVSESQHVQVGMYNVLGQQVRVLHDGTLTAGQVHRFALEAGALPGGLYLIRVTGETFAASRRVTLLK